MNKKRCLCCGKPLEDTNLNYHPGCIRRFFGTKTLPTIELLKENLEDFAEKSVKIGKTVAGVQKKLSLHLESSAGESRLTLVGYPAGYILKPESREFPKLPQSEFVTMKLAELWKIKTVPNALFQMADGSLAYIAGRIDRTDEKIAMEDFCQLGERLTEDKYKGSYEQCGKIISKYSAMPVADKSDFFNRLLFCFITGNNDMHLKNFSLIETGNSIFVLSAAYDLVSVQIVNPDDTEETALNLNGKKRNLKKSDFLQLAQNLGINENAAHKMIKRSVEAATKIDRDFVEYFLEDLAQPFFDLVEKRCLVLA